ncbi:MAG TPA: rod shape-determining protein MreD [Nocardioidaceae bacterium]|nr:rod shape-determining protein MreD [Nocardioidaceae bacterium]
MPVLRMLVYAALVVLAIGLQVGPLSDYAIRGVAPDLLLLVVVAIGLTYGPERAAVVGFLGGLALDLAPPSDHVAGRWALALVVVGYLVGLLRDDARQGMVGMIVAVAAASFVGTSIFALSGLVLDEPGVTVSRVLEVIPVAVLYDVALTPLLLPLLIALCRRLRPSSDEWVRAA